MSQDFDDGFQRLAKVEESLIVAHKRIDSREAEIKEHTERFTRNEANYLPAVKMANEAHQWTLELRNNMEKFAEKIAGTLEALHARNDRADRERAIFESEIREAIKQLQSTNDLREIEEAKQRGVEETLKKIAEDKKDWNRKLFLTFGSGISATILISAWWVYSSIHELQEHNKGHTHDKVKVGKLYAVKKDEFDREEDGNEKLFQ